MEKVYVITGGGSGMGLATAKVIGDYGKVVLVGRNEKKLLQAKKELDFYDMDVATFTCDISDKQSVEALADFSQGLGKVQGVLHAAGMSPHMGEAETIMAANALGTLHIHNAFIDVIEAGGCLIDVSSMSAYLTPKIVMPKRLYKMALVDEELFMKKMLRWLQLFPKKVRSGVAYGISKHFVIWLAKQDASRFGEKGIRVLSVTPGNFETPMGELEAEEAQTYLKYNAIKRLGKVDEIAQLFAACLDERMGYLTGTDIVCDGGCIASGVGPFTRK